MDPNTNQSQTDAAAGDQQTSEANKKAALAGQWRTPPMPVFPSGIPPPATAQTTGSVASSSQQAQPKSEMQLPDSTEDYAKALQEAYRRGAEAAQAQAMAQQQQTATQQPHQARVFPAVEETVLPTENPGNKTSPVPQQQPQTQPQPAGVKSPPPAASQSTVPNPLSMPPPMATPMNIITSTARSNVSSPAATQAPLQTPSLGPSPTQPPAPPPAQPLQQHLQQQPQPPPPQLAHPAMSVEPVATTTAPATAAAALAPPQQAPPQQTPPAQQRSMSLPDMSTYAAQQEEEKRQKRLARNRASARLRRLRKKNLVEAYEQEVGILEKTLAQLQAHEWGETDNVAALTEALSMDRGQQVLTFEQRHEAAAGLLDQQLQWLEMLEEIMMEDYVLQNVRSGEFAELREILGLDEEQLDQIEDSKAGWEEEWQALQTLKASLNSMRENDWLWNESVSSIAEQFMGILHKNQVSKFLLWADHNAEAIDELDSVNAYPGTPNGPVFAFGVESQPGENFEEKE